MLIGMGLFSCRMASAVHPGKTPTTTADQRFQATLDSLHKQYGFPGATAAFVMPDGMVGVAATGVIDLETGTPMRTDSRMLAASIGKIFVGATALMLANEGILDLDAPVSRWLGDRKWFSRLPNHKTVTLRHLLHHSSGLPDHVHLQRFTAEVARKWRRGENPFTPEELVEFVLDLEPLFAAGKGWAYTDTGYILAGLAIEKATGRSYYDEIKKRFLLPLGLKMTEPADRRSLPGLAAGYVAADNAFGFPRKTIGTDGALVWHPGFEWTGGGLVSNSSDLARWGFALFSGKVMPGACLNELVKGVPIDHGANGIQYGLGVGIYVRGRFGPVYGHGGWIPGYCSSLRYYPEHGVTVAFQINTDIGIADDSTPLMNEMESRLAEVVISAKISRRQTAAENRHSAQFQEGEGRK